MQSVKLFKALAARTVSRRNASYGHGEHNLTTYNDLPSPVGSWKTNYEAKQRKYNGHLVFGIGFTIVTIIIGRATGLLYLNYSPPARPADN